MKEIIELPQSLKDLLSRIKDKENYYIGDTFKFNMVQYPYRMLIKGTNRYEVDFYLGYRQLSGSEHINLILEGDQFEILYKLIKESWS